MRRGNYLITEIVLENGNFIAINLAKIVKEHVALKQGDCCG